MWTMPVEMPFVGGQYGAGVSLVVDQDVVDALPPYAAHEPLRVTVRPRRPRPNLDTIFTPSAVNTASNDVVNFASRSRTRKRNDAARSPRSMTRFRACCVVHSPPGFVVTPRMCTRRVTTSIPPGRTNAPAQSCRRGRSPPRAARTPGPAGTSANSYRYGGVPGQDPRARGSAESYRRRPDGPSRGVPPGSSYVPAWILPCQTHDQFLDLVADRRPGRFG